MPFYARTQPVRARAKKLRRSIHSVGRVGNLALRGMPSARACCMRRLCPIPSGTAHTSTMQATSKGRTLFKTAAAHSAPAMTNHARVRTNICSETFWSMACWVCHSASLVAAGSSPAFHSGNVASMPLRDDAGRSVIWRKVSKRIGRSSAPRLHGARMPSRQRRIAVPSAAQKPSTQPGNNDSTASARHPPPANAPMPAEAQRTTTATTSHRN